MITKVRSQAWSPYSDRGRARLRSVLAHDDPTDQIGAAWGVKEQLRLAAPGAAAGRWSLRRARGLRLHDGHRPSAHKAEETVT